MAKIKEKNTLNEIKKENTLNEIKKENTLKKFFKENTASLISFFLVITTANMYLIGYYVELENLRQLNVPYHLIEMNSPDYYILNSAPYVLLVTTLVIAFGLKIYKEKFKVEIENATLNISRVILHIAIVEAIIVLFSFSLHNKLYKNTTTYIVNSIEINKKDNILDSKKTYDLLYETKEFLLVKENIEKQTSTNIKIINKKYIDSFEIKIK